MEEKTKLDGYCIPLVKDEPHTLNNTNGWRYDIQPWTDEIDSSLWVKHNLIEQTPHRAA